MTWRPGRTSRSRRPLVLCSTGGGSHAADRDNYRTPRPAGLGRPQSSAVDPFEAFVALGDVFRRPREVLSYPGLSSAEKRAILASWATDARAVGSCPALRCLPGCRAEPVPLDEVLAALQALDGDQAIGAAAETPKPWASLAIGRRWPREAASWEHGLN